MPKIWWRGNWGQSGLDEKEVSEDWPFPVALYVGESDNAELVGTNSPLPVQVSGQVLMTPARRVVSTFFIAAAAGDYAAGDIMSNSVTDNQAIALRIDGVVDVAGQVAILDKVVARCSEDSVLNRLRLHFYRENPLPAEVEMDDNIAADFAKTALGFNKYIGPVPLVAFADGGTAMAFSSTPNLREQLKTAGSTSLWIVVETLDAEVNETAGMNINFDFYFLN